jgi:hypothetical protein
MLVVAAAIMALCQSGFQQIKQGFLGPPLGVFGARREMRAFL